MKYQDMYKLAKNTINPQKLNKHAKIGDVVCVLISSSDHVYVGISLVATCGLGYCAEQAAIIQMINNGESLIKSILVLDKFDNLFPPCGKCLELMTQINMLNKDAEVYLSEKEIVKISSLMPYDWKVIKDNFLNKRNV